VSNCKVIRNYTGLGTLYIPTSVMQQNPTEAAYGTWEWWFYKRIDTSYLMWVFIGSSRLGWADAGQNGYVIQVTTNEAFHLRRVDAGALTTIMNTGNSYVSLNAWHKIKISRLTNGSLSCWLDDTLVVPVFGTNPVVDTTYSTSSFINVQPQTTVGDTVIAYSDLTGGYALKKNVIALP